MAPREGGVGVEEAFVEGGEERGQRFLRRGRGLGRNFRRRRRQMLSGERLSGCGGSERTTRGSVRR